MIRFDDGLSNILVSDDLCENVAFKNPEDENGLPFIVLLEFVIVKTSVFKKLKT